MSARFEVSRYTSARAAKSGTASRSTPFVASTRRHSRNTSSASRTIKVLEHVTRINQLGAVVAEHRQRPHVVPVIDMRRVEEIDMDESRQVALPATKMDLHDW